MLTKITSDTFSQLRSVLDQMTQDDFTKKLEVLNHNSIGQHVRHILEFYICLSNGIKTGVVDYDKRQRNLSIESDPNYANIILDKLTTIFCENNIDETPISNVIEFQGIEIESISSVNRELVYLIEHSIHHYAIIGIALRNDFKNIMVDANFGVAYSTCKHNTEANAELVADHHH